MRENVEPSICVSCHTLPPKSNRRAKTKLPPSKTFLISCPSPASLSAWMSHLEAMARRRNDCPPAGPPERLAAESVCAHTSKCVLINIGRAGQHSGSGWRWERGDSSFHCHLGRKSAGGEGNEPETGWEEKSGAGARAGRNILPPPPPSTPTLLTAFSQLLSFPNAAAVPRSHTHQGEHHQGSLFSFPPLFLFHPFDAHSLLPSVWLPVCSGRHHTLTWKMHLLACKRASFTFLTWWRCSNSVTWKWLAVVCMLWAPSLVFVW